MEEERERREAMYLCNGELEVELAYWLRGHVREGEDEIQSANGAGSSSGDEVDAHAGAASDGPVLFRLAGGVSWQRRGEVPFIVVVGDSRSRRLSGGLAGGRVRDTEEREGIARCRRGREGG